MSETRTTLATTGEDTVTPPQDGRLITRKEAILRSLKMAGTAYAGMVVLDTFVAPATGLYGNVLAAASPASPSVATDGCTCSTEHCI
jgi:hypothetical protein